MTDKWTALEKNMSDSPGLLVLLCLLLLTGCGGKPKSLRITAQPTVQQTWPVKAYRDEARDVFIGPERVQMGSSSIAIYGADHLGAIFTGTYWYDLEGNPILVREATEILTGSRDSSEAGERVTLDGGYMEGTVIP